MDVVVNEAEQVNGGDRSGRDGQRPRRPDRGALRKGSVVIATRSWISLVAVAMSGIVVALFLYAIRAILVQLLCAGILAVSLEPLVSSAERRGLKRSAAVAVTFVVFLLAAGAFVYALVPPITEGLPRLVHEGPQFLERLGQIVPLSGLDQRSEMIARLRDWWDANGASAIGVPTLRLAKGVLDTGSAALTVVFLALFLLLSAPELFRGFLELVPEEGRALWRRMGQGVTHAVGGYVLGNVAISVVAGTVATVVLLVMQVPYALPLGLIVAVFDLIPMVGATLALVIVGLVALTRGLDTCAIVVATMVIYQMIENHVLVQAVYHGTVKLSLMTIAVALAVGAELGGVAGAVMAIPIAGVIKVVLEEVLAWRRGGIPAAS